jgi:hypothetical protein
VSDRILLLELRIDKTDTILRYNASQTEDYAYDGYLWEYAPFEVKTQPEQNLELTAENAQIWIVNNSIVRSLINDHDGLRRSIVFIQWIDPAGIMPSGAIRSQVASSAPIGGYYTFNLSTPTNALNGAAINRYYSKQIFPELPTTRAQL